MVREFGLVIVPAVPLDVHTTPIWLVAPDPAVIFIAPELAQVSIAGPAIAVGEVVIVTVAVVVKPVHPPVGVIV